ESRVPGQVADAERDGQVEHVDPPARQRLVVLGDVAVPDVAGLFRRRVARAPARGPPQQPGAATDVEHHEDDDVQRPRIAHREDSWSSSSGSRAAWSKSCLCFGLQAQIQPPTKASSRTAVTIPEIIAFPPPAARSAP